MEYTFTQILSLTEKRKQNVDVLLLTCVPGKDYYRLTNEEVDEDYPKQLRKWKKLPRTLDAAFQWHDGKTYFIKNRKIYSFDDDKFEVCFTE